MFYVYRSIEGFKCGLQIIGLEWNYTISVTLFGYTQPFSIYRVCYKIFCYQTNSSFFVSELLDGYIQVVILFHNLLLWVWLRILWRTKWFRQSYIYENLFKHEIVRVARDNWLRWLQSLFHWDQLNLFKFEFLLRNMQFKN